MKCDACGKVTDNCNPFNLISGIRFVGKDDNGHLYRAINLCPDCCALILRRIINDYDAEWVLAQIAGATITSTKYC